MTLSDLEWQFHPSRASSVVAELLVHLLSVSLVVSLTGLFLLSPSETPTAELADAVLDPTTNSTAVQ